MASRRRGAATAAAPSPQTPTPPPPPPVVPPMEAERRLRPVAAALAGGSARQALKLATAAAGRHPGWPAAVTLQAVALSRLGRTAEAVRLAARVRAAGGLDAGSARRLAGLYDDLGQPATAAAVLAEGAFGAGGGGGQWRTSPWQPPRLWLVANGVTTPVDAAAETAATEAAAAGTPAATAAADRPVRILRRGPALARLELALRTGRPPPLADLVRYYARFGATAVAAADLRPYAVAAVGGGAATCGGNAPRASVPSAPLPPAALIDALAAAAPVAPPRSAAGATVTLGWLRAHLSIHPPTVAEAVAAYGAAAAAGVVGADGWLALAAAALLPPGAPQRAWSVYRSLDVKHVQVATLSHTVLPGLAAAGAYDQLSVVATGVRQFRAEVAGDGADGLARAFGP
ncbi:hypothetical protein I4F81_011551 [Pyropia yezoensis]|uniref:Uncharacterized protein n=1 Tax=Pyropia yezoensis TaxID=2788 RepID=A0ACC3CFW4_PYRYE|nr:hypothetical protein I4F81_011551 [Neopyropia yezoensis]